MTIKLGKKAIITLSIIAIVAIIYNVLYFAIPWNKALSSSAFWMTYAFSWLSFIFSAVVTGIAFSKKELKSRIFGIPIHCIAYSVVLIQLVLDFIIMGVGSKVEIQFWIPLIIEVVLYGVASISAIAKTAYRDHIDTVDNIVIKKAFIQQLRIKADSLVETNKIGEISSDLIKLSETIKSTDPVSYKEVEELEDQITVSFEDLEKAITDGDIDKARLSIAKVNRLLNERKAILKNAR